MIRFLARIGGKRNEQLINELIKSTDEVGHPFMTQIKIFGHAEGNDFYTALASIGTDLTENDELRCFTFILMNQRKNNNDVRRMIKKSTLPVNYRFDARIL